MQTTWQHDKDTGEHHLPLTRGLSVKVYKTPAGDYALTAHSDEDGCGGEVDYFETLRQAKRHGDEIAAGRLPDPDGRTHARRNN